MERIGEIFQNENAGLKGFYIGVEYEIEEVKFYNDVLKIPGIGKVDKDGSLRGEGYEFITSPLKYESALEFFKKMHASLKYHNKENAFNERTSTHVHLNCEDLTLDQGKLLLLSYALLEPAFFDYAGDRQHNIHCVPLSYTPLPNSYSKNLVQLERLWSKYTAFNIKPLSRQCTVEFRHLKGTDDFEYFKGWIDMIKGLYDFIVTNPEYSLGKFLAEGNGALEFYKLVYNKPCKIDPKLFVQSTIDVKEAFI